MASNVLSKEWGAALITKVKALLGNKVDKVAGKGLSTNDLTTALKTSYDGAVSGVADLKKVGAEKNTIVGIKVNGTAQTVDSSRNVDLTVPTDTQIATKIEGYGYQTAAQVDKAVTDKGYQTAANVKTTVEGYGYQTAAPGQQPDREQGISDLFPGAVGNPERSFRDYRY